MKKVIKIVAILEMLIGAITLFASVVYYLIGISEKPLSVLIFVLVSSVISLLLGGFTLLVGLYKWNDGNKPYNLPYLALARYKKSIDLYNSKKLKDYTIAGSMAILIAVYVIWESNGVWHDATVLEAPAWFAVVFSLILMLYGVLLMNFYSWTRIKRFIRLME